MRTQTGTDLGVLITATIAAVLVAVGSFGAWAVWGPFQASGLQGGRHGWITLGIAAAAAVTIWRCYVQPGRVPAVLLAAAGAGAVVVGVYDARDITSVQLDLVDGGTIGPDVGWGIWMVIAAGAVLLLAGAVLIRGKQPRTTNAAARREPSDGVHL